MIKDIAFIERYKIAFSKPVWRDQDISLARSIGFEILNKTILCDMNVTAKRSLFEYLNFVFETIMKGPSFQSWRDYFFSELSKRYGELHIKFDNDYLKRLPYYGLLYKHQKESIYFSLYRKYNLLALEQGLGKTITSASVSALLNIKKTIVICPAVAKWNWFRDLTSDTWKFHPMFFTILDAQERRSIKAFNEKYIIINFDILEKHHNYLAKLKDVGHIIIDECHAIKSSNIRRYKNVERVVKAHPNAKITMLSGTPVKNRINDLFAYLKLSNHELGFNYAKFLREFTHTAKGRGGTRVVGGKNMDGLYRNICNFMLRKRERDCVDLPDKIINKYYFELNEYQEEYDKIIAEMAQERDISNIHSSIHTLNIVVAKSKIKGIIDLAKQIIDQGRKPIIFASYNAPLDMLQEAFAENSVRVDGSVDSYNRDQLITKFKEDDSCKVFLGNMQAAGVAINLTNSSDVIFVNFPFTPAELEQAISRSHRIGQKERVKVYFTICQDSIDEVLFNILSDKSNDINAIINKNVYQYNMSSIQDKLFKSLIEKYKLNNIKKNENLVSV